MVYEPNRKPLNTFNPSNPGLSAAHNLNTFNPSDPRLSAPTTNALGGSPNLNTFDPGNPNLSAPTTQDGPPDPTNDDAGFTVKAGGNWWDRDFRKVQAEEQQRRYEADMGRMKPFFDSMTSNLGLFNNFLGDANNPFARARSSALDKYMEPNRFTQQRNTALQSLQDLAYGKRSITDDPSYQFRMNEGAKALERSAAARGGLFSGRAGKEMARYGQDVASQEYGNAFNRANQLALMMSDQFAGEDVANQQRAQTSANIYQNEWQNKYQAAYAGIPFGWSPAGGGRGFADTGAGGDGGAGGEPEWPPPPSGGGSGGTIPFDPGPPRMTPTGPPVRNENTGQTTQPIDILYVPGGSDPGAGTPPPILTPRVPYKAPSHTPGGTDIWGSR